MNLQEELEATVSEKDVKTFSYKARFQVLKKLGGGGMGSVYLAEQYGAAGFQKIVAIKTIKSEILDNSQSVRMFIEEAKLVADLSHENIVHFYHMEKMGNRYFVVMEYVDGRNLNQLLKEHQQVTRRFPIDLSAFIASRVCRALHYAHTKLDRNGQPLGIVHRDISPANIMIDNRGVVKLADFGIAKAASMQVPDEREFLMGKYRYMSPEQLRYKGTDRLSDIYSLGLVFYQMLSGRQVFQTNDREFILNQMENFQIKPIREHNPAVSKELNNIVMKAVEERPERRHQSAKEMGDELEQFMYKDRYGPTNEKLADYLAKFRTEFAQLTKATTEPKTEFTTPPE